MDRTYENAINIINSRRRQSRPDQAAEKPAPSMSTSNSNVTPDLKGTPGITGMAEWLQMLGYSAQDINSLNIIHIAGTKGKGSTCAFVESFLRTHGQRTGFPRNTGMYTSPHLIHPEERIRINSKPLDRRLFAQYFFEIYDKLPALASPYDSSKDVIERGPRFLQLYALLAFHVFKREEVDVTVLETHAGGEYDATNVIQKPVVAATTTLGMDHVDMLGPTIENIAWHKSGIFKLGSVPMSAMQESAMIRRAIAARAHEKGTTIKFVDEKESLRLHPVKLRPTVQRENASLAICAADAWLAKKFQRDARLTNEDIETGVRQWSWPGRFQIIPDGRNTWFLDSAHNEMSVKVAAEWFAEMDAELDSSATRTLIFTHISESRDSTGLLRDLAKALKDKGLDIRHAIFTTYDQSNVAKSDMPPREQSPFEDVWREIYPESNVLERSTVQGSIDLARKLSENSKTAAHVLITGSQHLVGPALRVLQGD